MPKDKQKQNNGSMTQPNVWNTKTKFIKAVGFGGEATLHKRSKAEE